MPTRADSPAWSCSSTSGGLLPGPRPCPRRTKPSPHHRFAYADREADEGGASGINETVLGFDRPNGRISEDRVSQRGSQEGSQRRHTPDDGQLRSTPKIAGDGLFKRHQATSSNMQIVPSSSGSRVRILPGAPGFLTSPADRVPDRFDFGLPSADLAFLPANASRTRHFCVGGTPAEPSLRPGFLAVAGLVAVGAQRAGAAG